MQKLSEIILLRINCSNCHFLYFKKKKLFVFFIPKKKLKQTTQCTQCTQCFSNTVFFLKLVNVFVYAKQNSTHDWFERIKNRTHLRAQKSITCIKWLWSGFWFLFYRPTLFLINLVGFVLCCFHWSSFICVSVCHCNEFNAKTLLSMSVKFIVTNFENCERILSEL